jgi:hypothetical protein
MGSESWRLVLQQPPHTQLQRRSSHGEARSSRPFPLNPNETRKALLKCKKTIDRRAQHPINERPNTPESPTDPSPFGEAPPLLALVAQQPEVGPVPVCEIPDRVSAWFDTAAAAAVIPDHCGTLPPPIRPPPPMPATQRLTTPAAPTASASAPDADGARAQPSPVPAAVVAFLVNTIGQMTRKTSTIDKSTCVIGVFSDL